MKAILCSQYCQPDDLVLADVPDPVAEPGQAVIAIKAAALNFFDILMIQGKYQIKPPFPFSPAAEVAGVIESVGAGDPFAPVNATRLARMGWLMIGVQLSSVPIGALAMWIGERVKDVDFEFGISGQGIMLALVLFILARVFRHGAAMRDELEGTV